MQQTYYDRKNRQTKNKQKQTNKKKHKQTKTTKAAEFSPYEYIHFVHQSI